MKKENKLLIMGIVLLLTFVIFTLLLRFVDVKAVGPKQTSVGFGALNEFVHNLTGVHMVLYTITDWLGLVPIAVSFGFAILGLVQWIKRGKISNVDATIIALGIFYVAVMALYALFEIIVINYRPVLINGFLEASYPSSTTVLVMCVMPTVEMQFNARIKNKTFKRAIAFIIYAFVAFMVIGRLISGVHWFTDILAGAMLSAGLVAIYAFAFRRLTSVAI